MVVAVISDIHSNIFSYKLALEDLKKYNVERTIYLGDYITDGENENEILKLVSDNAWYAVLGNREKYLLNYDDSRKEYNNYKTIACNYKNLNKDSYDYIKSLLEHYIVEIDGYKVLIIHGNQYFHYNYKIETLFDECINNYDFDICLFGHTHSYIDREYKGKRFINPGSIGIPTDSPSYKYLIIDFSEGVKVTLREFDTADTFEEFSRAYRNTDYYKENYAWANLVLNSILYGKDFCRPFLDMFEDNTLFLKLDVLEFNRIWDETFEEFEIENKL